MGHQPTHLRPWLRFLDIDFDFLNLVHIHIENCLEQLLENVTKSTNAKIEQKPKARNSFYTVQQRQ